MDETHDFPTDDEDTDTEAASPYKTPKGKPRPKINRIWTAGTPRNETPKQKARQSSALVLLLDGEPEMGLPSLNSSISSNMFGGEDSDDEYISKGIDVTPRPPGHSLSFSMNSEQKDGCQSPVEDEEYDDDPPSMTLKEILLAANTSHFDLLGTSLLFELLRKYVLTVHQRQMAMIWRMGFCRRTPPSYGNDFAVEVSYAAVVFIMIQGVQWLGTYRIQGDILDRQLDL